MIDKDIQQAIEALNTAQSLLDYVHYLQDRIKDLEYVVQNNVSILEHEKEETRKQVAKEILKGLYNREEMGFDVIRWYAKTYYGVEVE